MKMVKLRTWLKLLFIILIFASAAKSAGLDAGKAAKKSQFPYMVQLARILVDNSTNSAFDYVCGGSLIHLEWILTSGQCFSDNEIELQQVQNKSYIAIVGSVISVDFSKGSSRRFIERIIRHPGYKHVVSDNLDAESNDIALAKTTKMFKLNKHIQTVLLASSLGVAMPTIGTFTNCTVMGFGIETRGRSYGEQGLYLKYVEVIIIPAQLLNIIESVSAQVFVSTPHPNSSINRGDLGSPLICKNVQFGIVSSLLQVDVYYVELYTQVEKYKNFILKYVPKAKFESFFEGVTLLRSVAIRHAVDSISIHFNSIHVFLYLMILQ